LGHATKKFYCRNIGIQINLKAKLSQLENPKNFYLKNLLQCSFSYLKRETVREKAKERFLFLHKVAALEASFLLYLQEETIPKKNY
jgi:hypothetical protein